MGRFKIAEAGREIDGVGERLLRTFCMRKSEAFRGVEASALRG